MAPVTYASGSFTKTEQNYAQIEKETLAIVFGTQRFHDYVYGKPVIVESDHKLLQPIFSKPITSAPPRIQRFRLKLQGYDRTIYTWKEPVCCGHSLKGIPTSTT